MGRSRLEAFSDGVLAIVITIMVLELRPPAGTSLAALRPLLPAFLSYVLSFVYVGIYWNNHHHLLHTVQRVDGRILWANLHLLFWLSLVPAVTAWLGQSHLHEWPAALYGVVLLLAGAAYRILVSAILALHGRDSELGRAIGRDRKGWLSLVCYGLGAILAFESVWLAYALYILVALMWLVPDRRIETRVHG
jgi:uncharacterized membrane protein